MVPLANRVHNPQNNDLVASYQGGSQIQKTITIRKFEFCIASYISHKTWPNLESYEILFFIFAALLNPKIEIYLYALLPPAAWYLWIIHNLFPWIYQFYVFGNFKISLNTGCPKKSVTLYSKTRSVFHQELT